MGKRQHQKDKMYLTCTEWSTLYGGKKGAPANKADFRRLPFDHCRACGQIRSAEGCRGSSDKFRISFLAKKASENAKNLLSLLPYEHPLCSPQGHIFDLMNIVPYLKKYGTNPVTGERLEVKALIKLNMQKNMEDQLHCPVLFKAFNNNSHVVAIKTTGNVFSYEAVEQLNLKVKNYKDLLTDEPFAKQDIITLQDPSNLEKFNLARFHHLKNSLKVEDEEEEKAKKDPKYCLKTVSKETAAILEELDREYKPQEKQPEAEKKVADRFNAAHYSTGAVAAGFTSTMMDPTTKHETAILRDDVVRYARVKKKGYVRIQTTVGNLNVELHCDLVPKTCENFLLLSKRGYYDQTIFHRSIKNFMIQGGDPTGTGKGGESAWGRLFKDEFKPNLTHSGRGVLSMANSGPGTNKSQFFISYRSCRHLDNKHTVFGRVVGGLETISAMERIETDAKDKPKETIAITGISVFVDPYAEVDEQLAKSREDDIAEGKAALLAQSTPRNANSNQAPKAYKQGVGKYIKPATSKSDAPSSATIPPPTKKRKKTEAPAMVFKDFSCW